MNHLLELPVLSTVKPIDVIVFYDEPVLFVGTNVLGHHYLVMLAEVTADRHRWLYAPLSPSRLDDVRAAGIDLHDAFANVEGGYIFEVIEESAGSHWRSVPVAEIDPDEFPVPGERVRARNTD